MVDPSIVFWPFIIAIIFALAFEMREVFLFLWDKIQCYLHDPRRPRCTRAVPPSPVCNRPVAGMGNRSGDFPRRMD